jgi:SAM-dependent methyltransferase
VIFKAAPIQKDWVPFDPNWTNSFDLILMVGFFDTYQGDIWALLRKAYQALKPGGYLEMHDAGFPTFAQGKDSAPAHRALKAAVRQSAPRTLASAMAGRRANLSMMAVGYTNVQQKMVRVPTNPHAVATGKPASLLTDEQKTEVMCAELVQMNMFDNKLLEKLARDQFVRGLGWPEERADQWVTEMAFEMEQTSIFAYMPL